MQYFRAVITSDTRGKIYKKDVEIRTVFEPVVRIFVSTLMRADKIREGEYYKALIIPHYQPLSGEPRSTFDIDRTKAIEETQHLSLLCEKPLQPDTEVSYFTLELLRVVKSGLISRTDLKLQDIDYFWQNLVQALLNMGILNHGEDYTPLLYARDDDDADFNKEEIYAQQETSDLIEIMPTARKESRFTRRHFDEFCIKKEEETGLVKHPEYATDETRDETVPIPESCVKILIAPTAMVAVQEIARSKNVEVEQGGVLVGNIYEEAEGEGYIVEITDYIQADAALSNITELRYTFESWQRQTEILKERFPGKRIVGWYHTHLVKMAFYTDSSKQSTYATELFFSRDDVFMHHQFFRERWYVAMVLDPQGNIAFFHWLNDKIGAGRKFWVLKTDKEC